MCGITGFYSPSNYFSETDLKSLTESIQHRGPDAEGCYVDNYVGLGHRRLSIIDLSSNANQPMTSQCGNYVIVYNGEVYNFKEIAHELKKLKPIFNLKTTSDTEVILEAFAYWGERFIEKLNGMFAFAIYNKTNNELIIYRDRLGIKPIYYYWDTKNFVFASELKAIKQLKTKINFTINKVAINEFLHLGYIPEPHSIYKNVYKQPSGSIIKINKNGLFISKYWDAETKITDTPENNFENAKNKLSELIQSSVKYRMISDVPFGTFLSGGIDSSIITAVAQKNSSQPINTFSIGFEDKKHNEATFAKNISNYLSTNHHEVIVTQKEAIELVPKIQSIYDEPYADSSAIPTLMVSQLAAKHVKMTLSGDGGDELFMGYGAYNWAKRLSNPIVNTLKTPLSKGLSTLNNKYKKAENLLNFKDATTLKSHIFSQEQGLFSRQEIRSLLNSDFFTEFKLNENYHSTTRKLKPEEEQALFDINYYLKDDLLVKVDRATMYHSIETRVPLLDFRIVEFALNLSPSLKIKNGTAKYLLKEVLYEYIPKTYFNRPKQGFSIPLAKWLKNELKFLIDNYLSEEIIKKHHVVNYDFVKKLKFTFLQNKSDYLYNRIWLLIVLHQWLEEN